MWVLIWIEMVCGHVLRKLGRLGDAFWLAIAVVAGFVWVVLSALYALGSLVGDRAKIVHAWIRARRSA